VAPADEGATARTRPTPWARWGPRGLRERDPAVYERLRTGSTVWTWLAPPLAALAVFAVDGLREAAPVWLWGYALLVVVFLLCRTKTVTWRFTTLVFTVGCLLAPVALVAETIATVAVGLTSTDLGDTIDRAVLIAAPVEEVVKLLPFAALVFMARGRLRSFAVTDYLLLGAATGLGLQVVEDSLHRLGAYAGEFGWFAYAPLTGSGERPGVAVLVAPGTELAGPLDAAVFAGHHVGTALVLGSLGLALRGVRRLGPVVWALPVLMFAMVTVDHALYNASVEGQPGVGEATVPGWLRSGWELWGAGVQERPLLLVLLVLGLVADARRTRWVWPLLPVLPVPEFVANLRHWSLRAAVSLRHWPPPTAPAPVRGLAGAAAGVLRWLGYAAADLLGELALLVAAATAHPHAGDSAHRRRRWVRTVTCLRMRREFAQRVARQVGRGRVPPARLPSFALASLACTVLVALGGAVVLLGVAGGAGGAAGAGLPGGPASVGDAFSVAGDWWGSLGPLDYLLALVCLAAMATLVSVALIPDTGPHGPVATAEELLNHPGRVVSRYLTTRTPGQTGGYLAEYLAARVVPARLGGETAARIRDQLDELVTDPEAYRRAEATLTGRLAQGEYGSAPARPMPQQISGRLREGRASRVSWRPRYPAHTVILADGRKFDAYLPHRAIVSRKFSQLGQVVPETAIGYLLEALRGFTPGDVLADTPYNRSNFRTLVGTKLRGEVRLEAPVQETPIPAEVLEAAEQLGVVIVDEAGTVYGG
jgi:RsiW-degrading membrane proteinase PrsW (M82 family)